MGPPARRSRIRTLCGVTEFHSYPGPAEARQPPLSCSQASPTLVIMDALTSSHADVGGEEGVRAMGQWTHRSQFLSVPPRFRCPEAQRVELQQSRQGRWESRLPEGIQPGNCCRCSDNGCIVFPTALVCSQEEETTRNGSGTSPVPAEQGQRAQCARGVLQSRSPEELHHAMSQCSLGPMDCASVR